MEEIKSIGIALDPNNIPAFLLDWELTKKCNLNCSYCEIGEEGGHDNSLPHPPLDECLQTIDFMYEYVSLYMANKKPTQRKVVLNVYGGESLYHPDIIDILTACREKYKKYSNQWELTITTTTNAIVKQSIWGKVIDLIDEFTVSYHAENLPKQEKLFFENLLELKNNNKRTKCVVMMHNVPELWIKSSEAVEFCKQHDIRCIPKPFDNPGLAYTTDQYSKFKTFWISNTNSRNNQPAIEQLNNIATDTNDVVSICEGRACCGGRKLSLNKDLKSSVVFVPKQGFFGWNCSVNWFFLFVQQTTGKVYFNKDCKMSFTGKVEAIGNLSNSSALINNLKEQLISKSMPVVKCAKSMCFCGYCAPKAENMEDFKELIKRNVITDVINYE
jgi:hypothetical protein